MTRGESVVSTLNHMDVAEELLRRNKGVHRAAEVEAWKLRDAHGRDTAEGRVLAAAAFRIADLHKAQTKPRTLNDLSQYNVPVFGEAEA